MPQTLDVTSASDEPVSSYGRAPSSPSNSWSSGETVPIGADSPLGDEGRRPKRCKISREQLSVLISSFEDEPLPNFDQRQTLAKMLGMTPRSVQIWFQNRRQRLKPMQPKAPSPSGSLGHGGMHCLGGGRSLGSASGQTPQQHLGMPGLAAAAGLCNGSGGSFESLMLGCAMSQLTNAAAGAAAGLNASTSATASSGGGFAMEPFAATKALLGAGYRPGSSASLASLARSPSLAPAATPPMNGVAGLPSMGSAAILPPCALPNIAAQHGDASSAGYPSDASLITPSTASIMGGGVCASKSEKADGLLLLLACADGNSEHSDEAVVNA